MDNKFTGGHREGSPQSQIALGRLRSQLPVVPVEPILTVSGAIA